jgi:TRAP-type mannitol/chloroaromatic compound transport system substrate-binding protein
MDAWKQLPEDLKWIVNLCAKETQLWSYNWINNLNAEAIRKFKETIQILKMDPDTLIAFRKTAQKYLDTLKEKYPDVKKVLESQEAFIRDFADWREARSGVTPWPYEMFISGRTTD